ncbi:MAG: signal peptidase II [candidate division WOR-3 bacterium]
MVIPSIIVFLDQLTKFLVEKNLPYHQPISVFGEFFRLTFVYNPGVAFGLNFGEKFPYTPIAIAITLFVLYLAIKEKSFLSFFAYCLIIGGALGNIIDRIFRGMVVDFLDIGINEHLRWFVFNLADSVITIAIFLLIFDSVFKRSKHEVKR